MSETDTSMTTTNTILPGETTDATNNMSSSSSQNSEALNVTTPVTASVPAASWQHAHKEFFFLYQVQQNNDRIEN